MDFPPLIIQISLYFVEKAHIKAIDCFAFFLQKQSCCATLYLSQQGWIICDPGSNLVYVRRGN